MIKKYQYIFIVCVWIVIIVFVAIGCNNKNGGNDSSLPVPDTWYNIQAQVSGKCADVAGASTEDGGNIQQWACEGQLNQLFTFVQIEEGYYNIEGYGNNKCWNVNDWGVDNGSNIQQWECESRTDANKLFKLTPRNDEYYTFEVKHSGKCVDVTTEQSGDDGANIQQWECTGSSTQLFRLISNSPNS